jgi:hypothetical protein
MWRIDVGRVGGSAAAVNALLCFAVAFFGTMRMQNRYKPKLQRGMAKMSSMVRGKVRDVGVIAVGARTRCRMPTQPSKTTATRLQFQGGA